MIANPACQRWCREGFCSLACYEKNSASQSIEPVLTAPAADSVPPNLPVSIVPPSHQEAKTCCFCGIGDYKETWSSWQLAEFRTIAIAESTSWGIGLPMGTRQSVLGVRFEFLRTLDVAVCKDCKSRALHEARAKHRKLGFNSLIVACCFLPVIIVVAIMGSLGAAAFILFLMTLPVGFALSCLFEHSMDDDQVRTMAFDKKYGIGYPIILISLTVDAAVVGKIFHVPIDWGDHYRTRFAETERISQGWSLVAFYKHETIVTSSCWVYISTEDDSEWSKARNIFVDFKQIGFNDIGSTLNKVRRPPLHKQ